MTRRDVGGERPRVLLAWELGDGFGHVGRLLALAERFEAEGFVPVFALRDTIEARRRFGAKRYPILQAPITTTRRMTRVRFYARSFADILGLIGYEDATRLAAMIESWRALVDLVAPRIVIGDFCPTLALALRETDVPLLLVGSGFSLPPAHHAAFPAINANGTAVVREATLLDAIRLALPALPMRALDALPRLIGGNRQCACTWPLFDPYRACRTPPALGPIGPTPAQRPQPREPHWFAYLAADAPNAGVMIDALLSTRLTGTAVIRHASGSLARRFAQSGKTLLQEVPRLVDVLSTASIAIHHGGINTAETALAMGVPQLIVARHLEQQLTGRAIAQAGIGQVVSGPAEIATIAAAIEALSTDSATANRAADRAAAITDRGGALDTVMSTARALIRSTKRQAGAA